MLAWSFIKWTVAKVFEKIADLNGKLREGLRYEPIETIFFWFLATILVSVINLLIMSGILVLLDTRLSGWFVLWLPLTMFAHLVYTGISVMYKCFKQERAELFETIKNGK
jgi:ABC-type transport system involved in Fe-S cluster assembly fused permease/ATPase subunit